MTGPMIETWDSAFWTGQAPQISVLIPFYKDNPEDLLRILADQSGTDVELIVIDDGVPDLDLNAKVRSCISSLQITARLVTSRRNLGRSAARNLLAKHARGQWLLFLDADMQVDTDFLHQWRSALTARSEDALFGGYTPCPPARPALAVHAALAQASDVNDAARRTQIGAAAVCSSNLAVRRDFFERCPFDEGYTGWGWEDVDWALSADASGALGHVDAPARHDGLQEVADLIAKFETSGPNFARLLTRHPAYWTRPGAQLACTLKRWRLITLTGLLSRPLAKAAILPIGLRVLALKLLRAAVAAQDLPPRPA